MHCRPFFLLKWRSSKDIPFHPGGLETRCGGELPVGPRPHFQKLDPIIILKIEQDETGHPKLLRDVFRCMERILFKSCPYRHYCP